MPYTLAANDKKPSIIECYVPFPSALNKTLLIDTICKSNNFNLFRLTLMLLINHLRGTVDVDQMISM